MEIADDNNVRMTIIYLESASIGDTDYQLVWVQIRQWSSGGFRDVIIEATVIVDGDTVVEKCDVMPRYKTFAQLQRHGIKLFDELLLAHPVLSPEAKGQYTGGAHA